MRVALKSGSDAHLLFNLQSYHGHPLENATLYGSMTRPGESTNSGMLAVGASPWHDTSEIRPFSSRGPMNDGTTKPDIVAADGTYSAVLGRTWQGTDSAAAHVAGLAALVKQRYPNYTPQQVADYLRYNAASRPADDDDPNPGTDANNTWGHGFALLPDDVEGVTPPTVDTCIRTIDGAGTYTRKWDGSCVSGRDPEQGRGDRYARYYTFTLDESTSVTVELSSAVDTYLYLMKGIGRNGELLASNDDIVSGNTNSQIPATRLEPGDYTIEATTFAAEETGRFTLVVDIEVTGEPTVPDFKYIAISSGANHVCAIATDGSIMCWGSDDSEGQISDRPTSGRFTQISSGDNHTCALRDDGAVICWGSFDVP